VLITIIHYCTRSSQAAVSSEHTDHLGIFGELLSLHSSVGKRDGQLLAIVVIINNVVVIHNTSIHYLWNNL
jgi:hypothetical protein